MRIFILSVLLFSTLVGNAQQDYTSDEVFSFAQIKVEEAKHMNLLMQEPPPGLDSSGMSYARYGEILRSRLHGEDAQLTPQDSASLKVISAAIQDREAALMLSLISKSDLTLDRYQELDRLRNTDQEFSKAYLSALQKISKPDDH